MGNLDERTLYRIFHFFLRYTLLLEVILLLINSANSFAQEVPSGIRIVASEPVRLYDSVTSSRTGGVAPLSVHFSTNFTCEPEDASAFHIYDYTWDFGDPSSGNWGTTGKTKNIAKGGIAAHIFEEPGTFSVKLTVRDQKGIIDTKSFTITVIDPDVYYSGLKTTCVNPLGDSDFSIAPTGARLISTDDLSTITQYATAGSRILFKRGATWTTSGLTWPNNSGPVTIGAYGTGILPDEKGIFSNAPIIRVDSGTFLPIDYKRDWRIMDLHLSDSSKTNGSFGGATAFQKILFLRLQIDGFNIPLAWTFWNNPDQNLQADQMAVVSCDLSSGATNIMYVGSERLALLGNNARDADLSHVVRVWQSYQGIISHNMFSGSSLTSSAGRHALKLHGPSESIIYSSGWDHLGFRTEFSIISDNIFGSSGPAPIAIKAQNDQEDERLSNIIFERNLYSAEYGNPSPASIPPQAIYTFHAQQLTVRNNIIDATGYGSDDFDGIMISSSGVVPVPVDIWIYNNTIYKPDMPLWGRRGITIDAGVESAIIRNNLVSFPGTINGSVLINDNGVNTIKSNNLLNGTIYFVDPENISPLLRSFDLKLNSYSAIDQGLYINSIFDDFSGGSRPQGNAFDIGAHE
ncbi:PKD domain-containing protein [Spirochaeta isovalerica]|uniref:PKD repeat protein n=1 Tax=Spirochaeta isovalerica TaxID=150 RepID=A0A841R5Z5_9SPIO|nr:PKD domain-containing protein [Spirochaeta isovalerica]MBB6479253.1 PKD repeat protein [Spirochaeta isovalerica]